MSYRSRPQGYAWPEGMEELPGIDRVDGGGHHRRTAGRERPYIACPGTNGLGLLPRTSSTNTLNMERMSTLPTIKCSSCAVDIDILHLADHVCAAAPPSGEYNTEHYYTHKLINLATTVPEPMSPTSTVSPESPPSIVSPKLNRAATFGGPTFSNRSDRVPQSGRMPPPPRIDSNAASKQAEQKTTVAGRLRADLSRQAISTARTISDD